jgi:hypothetical protein
MMPRKKADEVEEEKGRRRRRRRRRQQRGTKECYRLACIPRRPPVMICRVHDYTVTTSISSRACSCDAAEGSGEAVKVGGRQ